MKTVYIIQNSQGKNFEPAKQFGEISIMLRGNESPEEALRLLDHYLSNFEATDYLLLVGNPYFIAMASIIAWQQLEPEQPLQVLVWDKMHYKYNIQQVNIQ